MSAIKDGRLPITLDKERHMLFSLNVMDEVEDRFGSLDKLTDALNGEGRMKNVRWLFTLLLNEGAADNEEPLTEKQVGKMIHGGNMAEIQNAIYKSFALGNRGTTEPPAEEDEEPDEDGDDSGGEGEEEGKNAQAGKEE
ncbi:MAG: hypothetical protein LBD02_00865 [Christensenellaceae bacterium]|jgi:hypothetical protein|nr:hypothetical protein [Christensenellaceae bacterium]